MLDTTYVAGMRQQTNIPNWLTASRVFLTAPIIIAGAWGFNWVAVALVALAALSDGLDGYLARRWDQLTPLGRVGDPLADKFFITITLLPVGLAAVVSFDSWLIIGLWVVNLAYDADNTWQRGHEIARAFLNLPNDKPDLPASFIAKCKTALLFLLVGYANVPDAWFSIFVLGALASVSLSMVVYSWYNNRRDWLQRKLSGF